MAIEETLEMADWLKTLDEYAVSLGVSKAEARRILLREHPTTPLAQRVKKEGQA